LIDWTATLFDATQLMIYLWHAVDHEGEALESLTTITRDKKAALVLMKKALKRHESPVAITTYGLCSYGAYE
jgi:putative transposase